VRHAVLSPEDWNAHYPPGTRVRVTRANGTVFEAVTAGLAHRVGLHAMIELVGLRGLWMLAWCEPASR
jgi:hypothetical protein